MSVKKFQSFRVSEFQSFRVSEFQVSSFTVSSFTVSSFTVSQFQGFKANPQESAGSVCAGTGNSKHETRTSVEERTRKFSTLSTVAVNKFQSSKFQGFKANPPQSAGSVCAGTGNSKHETSVEEILPPLIIRPAHQPHNVPAGVQVKRAWLSHEFHPGLGGRLVALAPIAGMAAGHQIFPRR